MVSTYCHPDFNIPVTLCHLQQASFLTIHSHTTRQVAGAITSSLSWHASIQKVLELSSLKPHLLVRFDCSGQGPESWKRIAWLLQTSLRARSGGRRTKMQPGGCQAAETAQCVQNLSDPLGRQVQKSE